MAAISSTCSAKVRDLRPRRQPRERRSRPAARRRSCTHSFPRENFQVAHRADAFPDAFADVVLCNSVLHFARDDAHFRAMLAELWRVLRPGGLLFTRLGSRIGMDFPHLRSQYLPHRRRLRSGSLWMSRCSSASPPNSAPSLVDPLKTTIVQDYRCMTTWVLRKRR
jgi:SAM-dependent methyltransferase